MIVVVTGDRAWEGTWPQFRAIRLALMRLPQPWSDITLVHGDCRGADRLVDDVATQMGFKVAPYPAHWRHGESCPRECAEVTGRAAGPIRNRKMLDLAPDLVLAFHDAYDTSRGTKDCAEEAERRGIRVMRIGSTHPSDPLQVLYDSRPEGKP